MSVETDKAAADGGQRGGGEMKLVARGKRDAEPVLVKIGIAIALSFAGFVVSQLRPRSRPPPRRPSPRTSSPAGAESETGGKDSGGCLKEELRILKSEEPLMKIINDTTTTATMVGLSPTSSGDVEGFLLPEFNDFVMQEFEVTSKDLETTLIGTVPGNPGMEEAAVMQQEIASLRELVFSLEESERSLKLQLLDYHGVKEQEAAMRELESRLKISAMEAQMYILKVDSLQGDNQRLQAQLADYSRVMNELEDARAKIKLLEEKLKSGGEQAKEIMASLHKRISSLQQREQKEVENVTEVERKLKMLEELEDESVELRMTNSRLAEENSDLAKKLECAQLTVSSVLEGAKVEALEEANHLRKVNEKLMEEIEQLQTDRCADVEELVYLRWVNACLRYELRNYHPPLRKTVARDLSKSLSPKSEEKAKQLILEYSNLGADGKSLDLFEVDSEYSSSSQVSAGEPEDTSIDAASSIKHSSSKKGKFLRKLKKLVLGKGNTRNRFSAVDRTASSGNTEIRGSFSTCSIDDVIGRYSYDSSSSCAIDEVSPENLLAGMEAQTVERQHDKDISSQINSRLCLDTQSLQRLDLEEAREEKCKLQRSNCITSYGYKKISFLEDTSINCSQLMDPEDTYIPEKAKLKKFAHALRSSRGMPKLNRRSSSCRY